MQQADSGALAHSLRLFRLVGITALYAHGGLVRRTESRAPSQGRPNQTAFSQDAQGIPSRIAIREAMPQSHIADNLDHHAADPEIDIVTQEAVAICEMPGLCFLKGNGGKIT